MPDLSPGDWVYLEGFASEAGSVAMPVRDRLGEFDEPLILACGHCVGALASGYSTTRRVRGGSRNLGRPGGSFDFDVGEVVRSTGAAGVVVRG